MKKIIIGIIALLILSSGVLIFTSGNEDVSTSTNTTEDVATQPVEKNDLNNTQADGSYIEYSDTSFADKKDTNRVLFFHASWCSVCNFYESEIEQNGVPANVTIFKIDYDTAAELKEKYDVTVQSTFIQVDQNGDELQSWPYANGLNNINDLYSAL